VVLPSIEELEKSWDPDDGVFARLREGVLDTDGLENVANRLEAIKVPENSDLPRRFVSLVWFIPIFFEWQRERVREQGGDMEDFARLQNRLTGVVQGLLGVP
jgi:hypothetical protein